MIQPAKKKMKMATKTLSAGGSRARVEVVMPDAPIESLLNNLDTRREAVETLHACLKAVRTYYDLYSKSMVTEPDYATRCSASRTLLAYDVGEPVKRQQIMVTNIDSMDDLKAKLATNPALCDSLAKMLAEAKAQQGATP